MNARVKDSYGDYNITFNNGKLDMPDASFIKFDSLTAGERNHLKTKFDLTDTQLDALLNRVRQNVSNAIQNPNTTPDPGFGTSLAFADEIMDYEKNKVDTMANNVRQNNPSLWTRVGSAFNSLGRWVERNIDYTKSHFFGQSDPRIINNVYNRVLAENIPFFDGQHYNPGETDLRVDPGQQVIRDAWGQDYWWPEEKIVIVRYQDKFAAFGEKFFKTLATEEDIASLDDPVVVDAIGNRFNDPNASDKIQNYVNAASLITSWDAGIHAFTGGDGIYQIEIERQHNLNTGGITTHWRGYTYSTDRSGNDTRVPVQDRDFLLDLLRRSRGGQ